MSTRDLLAVVVPVAAAMAAPVALLAYGLIRYAMGY